MKKTIAALTLALTPFMAHGEDFLYVLSAKAKLLSEPSFKAQIIDNMSKGEKVVELEKNKHWFKVKHNDKIGWLSRLAVSPNPPMKRVTLLAKHDENLANESRRRASELSTTAAVRGLREEERARLSDDTTVNYDALAQVESIAIDEAEVWRFLKRRPSK